MLLNPSLTHKSKFSCAQFTKNLIGPTEFHLTEPYLFWPSIMCAAFRPSLAGRRNEEEQRFEKEKVQFLGMKK